MMTTVSPAHNTSIRTQESTSLTLKTAINWLDMKGKGLIVLIAVLLIVLVGLVVFAAMRFTHHNHGKTLKILGITFDYKLLKKSLEIFVSWIISKKMLKSIYHVSYH